MEHSVAERRIKRTALTRDARRRLDQLIALRLLDKGHDPYKPSAIGKAGSENQHYEPDLRARWVFPTVGLSRAARVAREISAAAQGRNLARLRLVTLRAGDAKPTPSELSSHFDSLSQDINIHVPYMKKMGWVAPVLSVLQIRLDHDGGLDPHLHALWHIAPDSLDQVRTYLEERYAGGVWLDDKPVKSLRKAAFYIASGMLDYPAVPEWPDDVLEAIWQLGHRRMIRPAGWYAAHLKGVDSTPPSAARTSAAPMNGPQRLQDGARMTRSKQRDPNHSKRNTGLQKAASGSRGRGAGGRGAKGGSSLSTVRLAAPESEFYNPFTAPSVDEFWIVLRLLEARNKEEPQEAFEEFCTRLSLKSLHVRKAVARVESYVEANLFYPGGYWSPTSEGLAFLDKGRPHLQGLDMLAVELGADARWARQPGRQAFEARIGHGGISSPAGTPQPLEPEEE